VSEDAWSSGLPRALLAIAAAIAGCTNSAELAMVMPDTGPHGSPMDGGTVTSIREEFNNESEVATASVAIIDVNHGFVTLPAESFPSFLGGALTTISGVDNQNGLLEGSSLVVPGGAELSASDSIELRAADTIRISGKITAGPGGATFIAGQGIFIDGTLESEGPVRLKLANPGGQIAVSGRVSTLQGLNQASASISLWARGSVQVSGQLDTAVGEQQDSGAISIESYGDIEVSGMGAQIVTGDARPGRAGGIKLSSEGEIRILNAASLTTGSSPSSSNIGVRGPAASGGSIDLESQRIRIDQSARIVLGGAIGGAGGSLRLVAGDHLSVTGYSTLTAGDGDAAGSIAVSTRTASIAASTWTAGGGTTLAGRVFVQSAGDLFLGPGASITGGIGNCVSGGDVVIQVSGRIVFSDGVSISGGSASLGNYASCVAGQGGGNVEITAQQAIGPTVGALVKGAGTPVGVIEVGLDPTFTLPLPNVRVRTVGWVISKVFDRGKSAANFEPTLTDQRVVTPDGTFAKIQLAGASEPAGPFSDWVDESPGVSYPRPSALVGKRYLMYRVWLKGRALDAPLVDEFEIRVAP
jgi:hypothetical protein